jgi:hypothetical protein
MHLIEYLKASQRPDSDQTPIDSTTGLPQQPIEVEYRLACSGELYRVPASDWRKSDIARVLLREPFELFVVSQPFDDYPQELCARFTLAYITETHDVPQSAGKAQVRSSTTFLPDTEIVEDLCSILSLLARRLISVVGKTRERRLESNAVRELANHPWAAARALASAPHYLGSYGSDTPAPVLTRARFAVWRKRPLTIITSYDGQRVECNDPPPTGVDENALKQILERLPQLPAVEQMILACRLYKTALEIIESRPEITYQLLISVVETMMGVALLDYKPAETEMLQTKRGRRVQEKARAFGLDEKQAKTLALEACRDERWLGRKFKKFILDNVSPEEIDNKDPVFPGWDFFRPGREHFEKVLGSIYNARSRNLHQGDPFPAGVGLGTSTTGVPMHVFFKGLGPKDVPPVAWFERVVSTAARRYLVAQCSVDSEPFADFGYGWNRDWLSDESFAALKDTIKNK